MRHEKVYVFQSEFAKKCEDKFNEVGKAIIKAIIGKEKYKKGRTAYYDAIEEQVYSDW